MFFSIIISILFYAIIDLLVVMVCPCLHNLFLIHHPNPLIELFRYCFGSFSSSLFFYSHLHSWKFIGKTTCLDQLRTVLDAWRFLFQFNLQFYSSFSLSWSLRDSWFVESTLHLINFLDHWLRRTKKCFVLSFPSWFIYFLACESSLS